MDRRPVILGFSGSIRAQSANSAILHTLAEGIADRADMRIEPLGDVPLYNADLDGERQPERIAQLKAAVAAADALVMATPEYNYGISGVLKNAIDWISRPAYGSPLKGKPVLIITASPAATGGVRAQQQMRDTLAACLARVIARPEVVVPFVHEKVRDGRLVDQATRDFAMAAMDDLLAEVRLLRSA